MSDDNSTLFSAEAQDRRLAANAATARMAAVAAPPLLVVRAAIASAWVVHLMTWMPAPLALLGIAIWGFIDWFAWWVTPR